MTSKIDGALIREQNYSPEVLTKAVNIKLLICDVDGVLSDGKVYYSNSGEELKNFNIKDGLGIKLLQKAGVHVAIITGRQSDIVTRRAKELGIQYIYQGQPDKRQVFEELCATLSLEVKQVAHIGDDLPDLPLMRRAGLGISVADGYPFVRQQADWTTEHKGGEGAVRDVADLILLAQNKLFTILDDYLN